MAQNLPAAVSLKEKETAATQPKSITLIDIISISAPFLPFQTGQGPSNVPSIVLNPLGQVSETEYVATAPAAENGIIVSNEVSVTNSTTRWPV